MAASGWGLLQARNNLAALHSDRMVTLEQVNALTEKYNATRLHILLGFQHDPSSSLFPLHDHPLAMHTAVVKESQAEWDKQYKQLLNRHVNDEENRLIQDVAKNQDSWLAKATAAADRLEKSDFSIDSMQAFLVDGRTEGVALLNSLTALQDYQSVMADAAVTDAEQQLTLLMGVFAFILVFIFIPCALMIVVTMRRLSHGFRRAVEASQAIAGGDLSRTDDDSAHDEIGKLLTQMRLMRQHLHDLIERIVMGADSVATAADTVANGTQDLSARTEQQAAALEETSAATEELNSTVLQNAENVGKVDTMSISMADMAERGGRTTTNAVETMETIRQDAMKIGDIVGIIDGIAFQTNILALNAAVEAARAGESGRGFAVVASEVRALAQRSASAAAEIKEVAQTAVDSIRNGSEQVADVGTAMTEIVDRFRHMATLVSDITNASKEQTIGLQQINEAVTHMDGATQHNVSLVQNTLSTSEQLQQQAAEFRLLVSAFKLSEQNAPTYHVKSLPR